MTVVDQVSWRQSMQAFVYCHGELVLNPLANWQPMKVVEHRSDVVELLCARHACSQDCHSSVMVNSDCR